MSEVETNTKTESMDDYKSMLEHSFRKLEAGDIITGTVIDLDEDYVTVDLNYYTQGIIKTSDLSNDPGFSFFDEIRIGDPITAVILSMDSKDGSILLSKKEAENLLSWEKLEKYKKEETILTVKISGIVNGGVIAYVEGIRGFLPASQLSLEYVEDLNDWLHKKVDARVITVNESEKKLVLSAKVVAKERAKEELSRRISMIVPGTILNGTVETITKYGAFIQLGDGLSGLLHISQISHRRLKSPKEVLKEGDAIQVKVISTDNGKISLSRKELEELPVEAEELPEVYEYHETEAASTSLAGLLSGFSFED